MTTGIVDSTEVISILNRLRVAPKSARAGIVQELAGAQDAIGRTKHCKAYEVAKESIIDTDWAKSHWPQPTGGPWFCLGPNLLVDVPITLGQLKHVPVKIPFLTALGSKVNLIPNPDNIAYALIKYVIDDILTQSVANVSSNTFISPASMALDTFEGLRGQCNSQKMGNPRFCILNNVLSEALGLDGRILSSLFYGQKNGEQALHRWKDISGFRSVSEYNNFPAGNYGGLAFDKRLTRSKLPPPPPKRKPA